MADAAENDPGQTSGHRMDAATRERLLAVLQKEIERASDEALARGVPSETLAALLGERIARLRAQIIDPRAYGGPSQT